MKRRAFALEEVMWNMRDADGVARCDPIELASLVGVGVEEVDGLLDELLEAGRIVYVTWTNKDTGQIRKIVEILRT